MGDISTRTLRAMLGASVNTPESSFPPMRETVLHTDAGTIFAPHAFIPGRAIELPLARGLGLAWTPCPPADGALLVLAAGNMLEASDEAIAVTLSVDGLRALARQLRSIAEQLEAGS